MTAAITAVDIHPRVRRRLAPTDRGTLALGIPLIVLLIAYVLIPLWSTLVRSTQGGGVSENYGAFLTGRTLTALVNSVGISLGTVVGCGALALLLAVIVTRFDFFGRRFIEIFALLPMAMPPLVGAMAFSQAFEDVGVLPRLIEQTTGLPAAWFAFNGISGVLLMHVMTIYPFFYLSLRAALSSADSSLEEAARSLGSGTWRTWRTVILPMLTPAIVSGSLITFMISMGSLTAPQMFGVTTLTTQLLDNRTNGAAERVAAQAIVLTLICMIFLLLVQSIQNRRSYISRTKGGIRPRTPVTSGVARIGLALVITAIVAFLSIPLITILLISFNRQGTWALEALPPLNTFDNYVRVFTDPTVYAPIFTSLRLTVFATVLATTIGVAAALVQQHWRWPGRRFIDVTIMIPWALPGTVVALNLIYAFITPSPLTFGMQWVSTQWILIAAYSILFLPLIFRSTKAALESLDPSLDEASRGLGASSWYTLVHITTPLIWRALLTGILFVFIAGLGEYVASVMLYTPRIIPMSMQMSAFINQNKLGMACAYGILKVVITIVLLIVVQRLERGPRGNDQSFAATVV